MKLAGSLALCVAALFAAPAMAAPVTINFEGFSDYSPVGSYYATAPNNVGVTFSSTAFVENNNTVNGNAFANAPSGHGVMYLSGTGGLGATTSVLISSATAFTGPFSLSYASLGIVKLDFYASVDGSGPAIASNTFSGNQLTGCANGIVFCSWTSAQVNLGSGVQSVRVTGAGAQSLFDDLTFSPAGSGGTTPEPNSIALVGLALLGLAASRRRGLR